MSASGAQSYIAMIQAAPGNPSAIPATPVMQKVNFMSSDLGVELETSESENMSGDRRTTDVTITGFTVGGGYEFEMTYENSLLDELMAGFLWVDGWSVDTPIAGTDEIRDSDFYQPFFMEKGHTDVAEYFQYMGMACNVWSLAFADQAMVTGGFQFVGLVTENIQTPTVGATYTEATTNPVFSTVTNVPEISIGGVVQTGCHVKEWTFELNNNVTPKTGVGTLGACETNPHKLSITGDMTLYFEDAANYDLLLAGTAFEFTWTMTDNLGNSYKFILPRCKLSADAIPIDGPEDVMENAAYIALKDPTEGVMIIIQKIDV